MEATDLITLIFNKVDKLMPLVSVSITVCVCALKETYQHTKET